MRSFGDCVAIITAAVSCFLHQQCSHQLKFNLRSFAIYKMVCQRQRVFFTPKHKKTRINCKIIGTTENAGLENTRSSYRVGVENARPVSMERRWYQCCKTEKDVVVRFRKHTGTGDNFICCNKFIQEKVHVTDTERVKKPMQTRIHHTSAKTHHSVKIANAMYPISY